MKTPSVLIVSLFLVSGTSLHGQSPQSGGVFPTDASIQQILDERVSEGRAVGLVVETRSPDGKVRVYHSGFSGRVGAALDGDSVFEIGSITKTFTATLLADMVTRGQVNLDDPVAKYLPPSIQMPGRTGKQITLVELATHSSGLPFLPSNLSPDIQKSWAEYTETQLDTFLSGYRLSRDPGEKFQYSDVGPGLLGRALAARANETWERAVSERILNPLKMSSTRQTLTPQMRRHLVMGHNKAGRPVPGWEFLSMPGLGALRSSANDLMRYLAANLSPPHTRLGEAITLSHIDRREAFNANTHIGLGWFLGIASDRNLIFHGGSTPGYNTFVGFDPVKGIAVVVLANSDTDITDIGFHLLEQRAPIDDDPPIVRALYAEAMKRGFDHLSDIVAVARHMDPAYVLPEAGVNSLGYRLLEQQRFTEAVKIFKLNVDSYPQSADAFDSLGESYEDLGDRPLAIQNYQRSLELNPKNSNAVEHLVRLGANPQR